MTYQPLDYELQRQRMIDYELQMNAVEAQKAVIEMGRRAKQSSQQVQVVHTVEVVREDDRARKDISRLSSSNSYLCDEVSELKDGISDLTDEIEDKDEEISDLEDEIEDKDEEISDLEDEVSDLKDKVSRLKKKKAKLENKNSELDDKNFDLETALEIANEEISELKEELDQLMTENRCLRRDLGRSGTFKPVITAQTISKAVKPVLARSMASQGHSNQPVSVAARWVMKKTIEAMQYGQRQLYVPTDDERKKLDFMEQHNLYRMNEIEIPSEFDHLMNMKIWNSN